MNEDIEALRTIARELWPEGKVVETGSRLRWDVVVGATRVAEIRPTAGLASYSLSGWALVLCGAAPITRRMSEARASSSPRC